MRISKLRETMAAKGVDVAFIVDEKNVRYYSGFTGDGSQLFVTQDEKLLFTDFRYTEQAGKQTSFEIIETTGKERLEKVFATVKKQNAKMVGIDLNSVTYPFYKGYLKYIDEKSLIDLSGDIAGQRQIKDADELAALAKGAQHNDKLFAHLCEIIKEGVSEKDLKAQMIFYMLKSGAEVAFDPIVASGSNSSLPHASPTDRKFISGDFITMDYGFKFDGYCSDFTRTVALGKVDKEQQKVYDIVDEASAKAFEVLKPGAVCGEVDKAARDYISNHGYGKYFGHSLGHSVGMDIHEDPRLGAGSKDILKPGMVVTIEPGIYLPDRWGVRIEDLCVITQSGYENLTVAPRELVII